MYDPSPPRCVGAGSQRQCVLLSEMTGHCLVLLLLSHLLTSQACLPFFFPFFPKPQTSSTTTSSSSSSSSSSPSVTVTRTELRNMTGCGQQGGGRIVGGDKASPHEFPWHCALLNRQNKFYGCSATLLHCDPVIIVTAAHCAPKIDIPLLPITIKLRQPSVVACGKNFIRDDDQAETLEDEEQRLTVKEVVVHPHYNDRTYENDIALIKVSEKFNCKSRVLYPACLPSKTSSLASYDSWASIVTGWGTVSEDGPVSTSLQKAKVPVVSDSKCREVMDRQPGTPDIRQSMLCAGDTKGKVDSCQGDSGGPLVTTGQLKAKGRKKGRSSKAGWSLIGTRNLNN